MRWSDVALLDEAGFSSFEKRALVTLHMLGVADAATLCREGEIPTSKIYAAMEKLERLGLVETQRTRPRLYAAVASDLVVDRLVEIARERAERFASRADSLRGVLENLPSRLRGRQTFVDLALGVESHVKRHLARLASAETRIRSYLEEGDLMALDRAAAERFDVLKRLGRQVAARAIDHRVVFGFANRNAPRLLDFLRRHAASLQHVAGVRFSGELGHPFHVIDQEAVILSLDHPFVPDGRFASLLVHDRALAESLAQGFDALWERAMRDLAEIRFHPHASRESRPVDD
jgi:sugar-specific transcriptional regulator TrmB